MVGCRAGMPARLLVCGRTDGKNWLLIVHPISLSHCLAAAPTHNFFPVKKCRSDGNLLGAIAMVSCFFFFGVHEGVCRPLIANLGGPSANDITPSFTGLTEYLGHFSRCKASVCHRFSSLPAC